MGGRGAADARHLPGYLLRLMRGIFDRSRYFIRHRLGFFLGMLRTQISAASGSSPARSDAEQVLKLFGTPMADFAAGLREPAAAFGSEFRYLPRRIVAFLKLPPSALIATESGSTYPSPKTTDHNALTFGEHRG